MTKILSTARTAGAVVVLGLLLGACTAELSDQDRQLLTDARNAAQQAADAAKAAQSAAERAVRGFPGGGGGEHRQCGRRAGLADRRADRREFQPPYA